MTCVKCRCIEIYQHQYLLQSVIMVPMDMTVPTTVVVTVRTTLRVTNKLVCVIGDVARDIQAISAGKVMQCY